MFMPYIYDSMVDNEECWVIYKYGFAILVSDASLMDC